jgi:hypothetical protein
MDQGRFDQLTRAVGAAPSRRGMLKVLVAGLASLLGVGAGSASALAQRTTATPTPAGLRGAPCPPGVVKRCADRVAEEYAPAVKGCASRCTNANSPECLACIEPIAERALASFARCKERDCPNEARRRPTPTPSPRPGGTARPEGRSPLAPGAPVAQGVPPVGACNQAELEKCLRRVFRNYTLCLAGCAITGCGGLLGCATCLGFCLVYAVTADEDCHEDHDCRPPGTAACGGTVCCPFGTTHCGTSACCAPNEVCTNGVCGCAPGTVRAASARSPAALSTLCCPPGKVECLGECVPTGWVECNGRCVDPQLFQADPTNCGACGTVCPTNQFCNKGICSICPPGFKQCGPTFGCCDETYICCTNGNYCCPPGTTCALTFDGSLTCCPPERLCGPAQQCCPELTICVQSGSSFSCAPRPA